MNRERRYFISSASSLKEGTPYTSNIWRKVNEEESAEPENAEITIPHPKTAQIYYDVCGKIDQHNRHHQENIKLELKLQTRDWPKRFNLYIRAMTMVDAWLVYKQRTQTTEIHKDFY